MPGGHLEITGIFNGDLKVLEGGKVALSGIGNGHILNDGGRLHVLGILNGSITTTQGETVIDPKAIVKPTSF